MPATSRPRRSVLYMPGSRERALEKARTLKADALILDLEDAVTPDEKANARKLVSAALKEGGYGGRELIIRINGLDTPWGEEDLKAACAARPDAVLIPKVETPEMIIDVAARMAGHQAAAETQIWAMIETPRGVLNAAAIAGAHPRLAGFVMGSNDLVKELRAAHRPGRAPIAAALGLCVLAARAGGLAAIDGVCNAYLDEDLLREECEAGRDMGYDGKTLIHPAQIAISNEVFGPSEDALAEAHEQLAAWEDVTAKGGGVAVVRGRIVENLHVETAKRLIAEAEAIAALEAEETA